MGFLWITKSVITCCVCCLIGKTLLDKVNGDSLDVLAVAIGSSIIGLCSIMMNTKSKVI